jgi:hypothetical protein
MVLKCYCDIFQETNFTEVTVAKKINYKIQINKMLAN